MSTPQFADLRAGSDTDIGPQPFDQFDDSPPAAARTFDAHRVVAVLVAHNGARWLPAALAALGAQTRAPDAVVAVDTGSTDSTAQLLDEAPVVEHVVTLDMHATFAAAVEAGIAYADTMHVIETHPVTKSWIWVLHDDSAPLQQALEHLLAAVDESPSIGIVGPKVRGWANTRQLLEVGLTVSGSGRRETGLERAEQDQGQHDQQRDVLAVGSAGMLVRRNLWEELGGFDQRIRLYRDDLDLGWRANLAGHRVVVVPDAVVLHAEAATHRRRGRDAARHGLHRADREASLHVLLANRPWWALPWTYLRLTVSTLLRTLGLFLAKSFGDAAEELAAYAAVVLRPDRVWQARRRRQGASSAPARELRPLMASWVDQARHGLDTVSQVVGGNAEQLRETRSVRARSGLDEDDELTYAPVERDERSVLRRLVARPGVLLGVALLVVALAASWSLIGRGVLAGGALLPADVGASDLFAAYRAGWHPVALGSTVDASPALWLLALGSLPLLGSVSLLVSVLVVVAVPLAGAAAYLAMRRLQLAVLVRVWAAVAYALLPAATGALASGRLGTVVAHVLLPALAVTLWHARTSARAAAAAALVLSVLVAFVPVLWPVALLLLTIAAIALRSRRAALHLVLVAISPLVLLLPWSLQLLGEPSRFLLELGAPAAELISPLSAWEIPLFAPGGPGTPPAWLVVGVLVAAFAALLLAGRRRQVVAAWGVALVGLVCAAVLARVSTTPLPTGVEQGVWTGPVMLVLGGALVVAAAFTLDRARALLERRDFDGLHIVAVAAVACVALTPVLLAGAWVARGAGDPMDRIDAGVLPGRVAALLESDEQPRALVLAARPDGEVAWSLERTDGPVLGQADLLADADQVAQVDALVSDMVSGQLAGDEQRRLADLAVASVVVADEVDASVRDALDRVPGITRLPTVDEAQVWELQEETGRLRILRPDGGVEVVRSPSESYAADVRSGPDGRRLVLSETADSGWRATLDGVPLAGSRYEDWAQAYDLPTGGGELSLTRAGDGRGWWLLAQGVLGAFVVLLALPGRRPDEEES